MEKCTSKWHAKCILELGNSLSANDTVNLLTDHLLVGWVVGYGDERPFEAGEEGFSAEAKEDLTVGAKFLD